MYLVEIMTKLQKEEIKGISLSKLSNSNIPYDTDMGMDNKLNNYLQIIGIEKYAQITSLFKENENKIIQDTGAFSFVTPY